jgi:hypothetical protein
MPVFHHVDTRAPHEVEREAASIYRALYPQGDRAFASRAFEWVSLCFEGRHPDFQAIDALYHDFEHTLQGTLCLVRLLKGRHDAQAAPPVPQKMFELALLAILFHDTGYLKRRDDIQGTGAKYTAIHVGRSAVFAREFLAPQGYAERETRAIENMIRCTGVNADLAAIPFQSQLERMLGFALGTADLLGQMAAHDYVDKLPVLYEEFAEAARAAGDKTGRFALYRSAEDLLRTTPVFWESYVLPRISVDFEGLYKYLNDPYPDGPNPYLQRIEANITRLRRRLGG